MASVDLILPNGTVMTASLPLHPQLDRQVRAGALKLGEPASSPVVGLDGEGDAERVSASPPVDDEPPVMEPSSVEQPAGNASQADWATYAVSQGMHPDEAAGLKREEIKSRITTDATPAGD